MTRFMLDTNIVSYYLRRSSSALEEKLNHGLRDGSCVISAITRAELRCGQAAMVAEDKRRTLIDGFFLRLPNLPWTLDAADQFGTLKAQLKRAGTPIGELDTQIAAHALAEGLVLVTHNTRHFDRIAGLKLEDWMV